MTKKHFPDDARIGTEVTVEDGEQPDDSWEFLDSYEVSVWRKIS